MYVASTARRLWAHFVDGIFKFCWFLPVFLQAGFHWFVEGSVSFSLHLLVLCWLLDISFRVCFIKFMGGTPGKLMFGLRIVSRDDLGVAGAGLGWIQVVIRVLADQLSYFFGWGPWSLALLRFDRTHVSDWLAETRVVQMSPRLEPPRRRWFWGLVLALYLSASGWTSAAKLFKGLEYQQGQVSFRTAIPD